MKNKIFYIALIPVIVILIFWLTTQAFHLISAPSDAAVISGIILLVATFIIIISLLTFIRRKLF